jgi:putative heme iron utilization protein
MTSAAYLRRHPDAEMYASFTDFPLSHGSRLRRIGSGFGRIVDLKSEDILTDIADASVCRRRSDAIAHMNTDHTDACRVYATRLLGAGDGDWRCVGIDPEGIELQNGRGALRLLFKRRIIALGALRAMLKELADEARSK